MALVVIELETLVSEPDALTTRPPPCACEVSSSGLKLFSRAFAELANQRSLINFLKRAFFASCVSISCSDIFSETTYSTASYAATHNVNVARHCTCWNLPHKYHTELYLFCCKKKKMLYVCIQKFVAANFPSTKYTSFACCCKLPKQTIEPKCSQGYRKQARKKSSSNKDARFLQVMEDVTKRFITQCFSSPATTFNLTNKVGCAS